MPNQFSFMRTILMGPLIILMYYSCGKGKLTNINDNFREVANVYPMFALSGSTCGYPKKSDINSNAIDTCSCVFNYIDPTGIDKRNQKLISLVNSEKAEILDYQQSYLTRLNSKLSSKAFSLKASKGAWGGNYQTAGNFDGLSNYGTISLTDCASNLGISYDSKQAKFIGDSKIALDTLGAQKAIDMAVQYCYPKPKSIDDLGKDDFTKLPPNSSGLQSKFETAFNLNKTWGLCENSGTREGKFWIDNSFKTYSEFSKLYYLTFAQPKKIGCTFGSKGDLPFILSSEFKSTCKIIENTTGKEIEKKECLSFIENYDKTLSDDSSIEDCTCQFSLLSKSQNNDWREARQESIKLYFSDEYMKQYSGKGVAEVCKERISKSPDKTLAGLINSYLVEDKPPVKISSGCSFNPPIMKVETMTGYSPVSEEFYNKQGLSGGISLVNNYEKDAVEACGCTFYNNDGKLNLAKSANTVINDKTEQQRLETQINSQLFTAITTYYYKTEVKAACQNLIPDLKNNNLSYDRFVDSIICKNNLGHCQTKISLCDESKHHIFEQSNVPDCSKDAAKPILQASIGYSENGSAKVKFSTELGTKIDCKSNTGASRVYFANLKKEASHVPGQASLACIENPTNPGNVKLCTDPSIAKYHLLSKDVSTKCVAPQQLKITISNSQGLTRTKTPTAVVQHCKNGDNLQSYYTDLDKLPGDKIPPTETCVEPPATTKTCPTDKKLYPSSPSKSCPTGSVLLAKRSAADATGIAPLPWTKCIKSLTDTTPQWYADNIPASAPDNALFCSGCSKLDTTVCRGTTGKYVVFKDLSGAIAGQGQLTKSTECISSPAGASTAKALNAYPLCPVTDVPPPTPTDPPVVENAQAQCQKWFDTKYKANYNNCSVIMSKGSKYGVGSAAWPNGWPANNTTGSGCTSAVWPTYPNGRAEYVFEDGSRIRNNDTECFAGIVRYSIDSDGFWSYSVIIPTLKFSVSDGSSMSLSGCDSIIESPVNSGKWVCK